MATAAETYEKTLQTGDAGVNQQAENVQTKTEYWNAQAQGEYPNAQKGADTAAATGTQTPAAAAPAPNFATLQEQGQARPPAPTASSVVGMGGGVGGGVNPEIQKYIMGLMQNPSMYTDEQFNKNVEYHGQKIDDDFSLREQQLREDMVRRGLSESSIQGGRLQDLNVGKRTAKADLTMQMAEARARQMDEAMARAAQLGLSLDQAGREYQRLALEGTRLAMDAAIADGRMSLEEARMEMDKEERKIDNEWKQKVFEYNQGRDEKSDKRMDDQFQWTQNTWNAEFQAAMARLFGTGVVPYGGQ